MRRKICYILVIAAIIVLAVCLLPYPAAVNCKIEGVLWNDVDDNVETVKITIRGRYYKYLLRNNVFKGEFLVSDVNSWGMFLKDYDILKFETEKLNEYERAGLAYYDRYQNKISWLGTITFKGNFKEFVISLDYSSGDDAHYYISSPSLNREEAYKLAHKMA